MTPIILIDSLAEFLKEVNKNYFSFEDKIKDTPLKIESGHINIRDYAKEKKAPAIEVSLLKVVDAPLDLSGGESTAFVRLYFVTYCEEKSGAWRELYNWVEFNRQALLKNKFIAKYFRLVNDLVSQYPEPVDQPVPTWVGFIDLEYNIPQVQEVFNYEY
ncbi:hypothetical protein LJC10_00535 [Selenomonadales bacterium OttesenSCG-928-I06]|nr:hypothetical protein [Selenomonadales bacterium OttesenSCG-928-I06]